MPKNGIFPFGSNFATTTTTPAVSKSENSHHAQKVVKKQRI
jgi:hypothetical protein